MPGRLVDDRIHPRLAGRLATASATFRSSRPGPISAAADDRVRPDPSVRLALTFARSLRRDPVAPRAGGPRTSPTSQPHVSAPCHGYSHSATPYLLKTRALPRTGGARRLRRPYAAACHGYSHFEGRYLLSHDRSQGIAERPPQTGGSTPNNRDIGGPAAPPSASSVSANELADAPRIGAAPACGGSR